jgi:hypothetical protein
MSDQIISNLQRGLDFGGCVLSAEQCEELLGFITAWKSCIKDANKGMKQITERVIAFAGQLEAWGYDPSAFDMLTEILGGDVNAPDYYAQQKQLAEAQQENARLKAEVERLRTEIIKAIDEFDYGDSISLISMIATLRDLGATK